MEIHVDGVRVQVEAGSPILAACDAAGRYVPRLCCYPDLEHHASGDCGLCVVRLKDGTTAPACATQVGPSMEVTTDDPGLRAMRRERLGAILARHPHICLSCPDRDGCARDECSYGVPPEARCCEEFGRCELAAVVGWIDENLEVPRTSIAVPREAVVEGRIRREPGLCVGCGRCVTVCEISSEAGRALEMIPVADSTTASVMVARPRQGTLRASGCTFCGQCVLVCPSGALTAPGEAGMRWLEGRCERSGLAARPLPPQRWQRFNADGELGVAQDAGVLTLFDCEGEVVRISGVCDLRRALVDALAEEACANVAWFQVEVEPLFTQRESELLARYAQAKGHLPPGNDLGDDLFSDDLLSDDLP